MKKIDTCLFILLLLFSFKISANETWSLDKDLSSINFELPVFLAKNVVGEFKEIEGLVEMNFDLQNNNRAIFSVNIESVEINYSNYRNLLLSNVFFNKKKYPIALIDTKKFLYSDQKEIDLNVEMTIKNITKNIPIKLEIIHLTKDLVQIKGQIFFSRTDFEIGIGKWSSTVILKDKVNITTNLFLFRD